MGGGSIRESWWFWWPSVTFKGGTQGGHFFSWISILNNVCIVWRRTIKFGRITCGGISRVSYIRPYCKRRGGAKRRPILGLPFYFAHSLLRRSTEFDVVTYMGRGACFYVVSHTPYLKVAGSQRSPILGVPFYFCVHPLSQNYQIWRGSTCGEGRHGVSHATHPKRADRVSAFPIFGVLLYLCLHPLTQNDQIRHSNIHGEGRVFGMSAMTLHFAQMRRAICQRSIISNQTD